eukprot:2198968-Prymnesium_polylepis.1
MTRHADRCGTRAPRTHAGTISTLIDGRGENSPVPILAEAAAIYANHSSRPKCQAQAPSPDHRMPSGCGTCTCPVPC